MQKGTTKPGGNRKERLKNGELVYTSIYPTTEVHAILIQHAKDQRKSLTNYIECQLALIAANGPYEQTISMLNATANQLRQLAGKGGEK